MILELQKVTKRYSDMVVIPELSLDVRHGDFVGIIGPNGAGKTTLFNIVAGALSCDSGVVKLDGVDVTALDASARCRGGIGRTFQIPKLFSGMTVYENVLVAATFGAGLRGREAGQCAVQALELCGLAGFGDRIAGDLTLLRRKRLELARAIATRPKLLLLDEVAGGLTEGEVDELLDLVVQIHRLGATVLWIEHLVHVLVTAAHRLVVLADGAVIADGLPSDVIASERVKEVYLGSDLFEDGPVAAH